MGDRVFNFSAGPATLPHDVLIEVQRDLLDWKNSGMSVMEVSHRGKDFVSLANDSEIMLRELLDIPMNYKVLFLQGGATAQFSAVPLNISKPGTSADYIITGNWGKKASKEAANFLDVNIISDQVDTNYTTIPDLYDLDYGFDSSYLHYTPNETVYGVEFSEAPPRQNGASFHFPPIVADMSSTLLSRPIEISAYDLIYAGAQKNIGPPGLTIVIVKESLLGNARKETPSIINYTLMSESGSMYNTPPTLSWYIATLVFKWLLDSGGLEERYKINKEKANLLYGCIDSSKLFNAPVDKNARSLMNPVFMIDDQDLEKKFLEASTKSGLTNLKGHRLIGGMRASIYNALPLEGVEALVNFINQFDKEHS